MFDGKLIVFFSEQIGILFELLNVDLNNKQLIEDFIKKMMRDLIKEQVGMLLKE